jgi:phage-related protein
MHEQETATRRPLVWIGSSFDDLKEQPEEVRREFGYALYQAQIGRKHPHSKPLRGFGGATVLEVVEDYDTDTFRAVYTVKFGEAVYVLHVFQKKSKKGIATAPQDIAIIKARLKQAEEMHKETQKQHGKGKKP